MTKRWVSPEVRRPGPLKILFADPQDVEGHEFQGQGNEVPLEEDGHGADGRFERLGRE